MAALVSTALVVAAVLGLVLGRLPALPAGALALAALLLLPAPDAARGPAGTAPTVAAALPAEPGYGPGPVAPHGRKAPGPGPAAAAEGPGTTSGSDPEGSVAPPDSPGPDSLLAVLAWAAAVGSTLAAVGRRRLLRARDACSTALFVRLVGTGGDRDLAGPRCERCEREGPGRRCPRCVSRRSERLDA